MSAAGGGVSIESISDCENSANSNESTASSDHSAKHEAKANELDLAKTETAIVARLRFIVLLVLFVSAISVAFVVFHVTSEVENQAFESEFLAAAETLVDAFIDISESKLGAIASLGVAIIAYGIDHRYRWPFISIVSENIFDLRSSCSSVV